jgi:tetratricopeptide (TPR) repeat protein
MRPKITKILKLFFTATLAIALVMPGVSLAQDNEKKERKTKETVAMSQAVYEKLQEIQELVELKDYVGAEQQIARLQERKKLTPYENAQIWNLSGYTYYLQERYEDAIGSYEQVLAEEDLPEALEQSTLKTIAQLYFTTEEYVKALAVVERLMAVIDEPSADIFMLKGQALFQMQKYSEAIDPIKTALDMYIAQGRTPRENWLLLLRVCYYELRDYPNMIVVVKQLLFYYPKDTYVLTLAGIHSELGDTKKQLALTEVLYEKGYLKTASHATNLANLYLMHDLPYKAATLLEKEIGNKNVNANERNLRLLSQAWYQAREDRKAIPPLELASEMSEDGELYIRLAQSHINLDQWSKASTAARKGINAGGLRRTDTANILLGMALFNERKLEQARRAFQAASRDSRSRRTADQWIAYVDSEIRRRDTLDQALPTMQPRELDDILKANEPGG